jgi:hypothetical protein
MTRADQHNAMAPSTRVNRRIAMGSILSVANTKVTVPTQSPMFSLAMTMNTKRRMALLFLPRINANRSQGKAIVAATFE